MIYNQYNIKFGWCQVMFFNHKQATFSSDQVSIINATFISDFNDCILEKKFDKIVKLSNSSGEKISVVKVVKTDFSNPEEYEINIDKEVLIKASTSKGALYALADIIDMALNGQVVKCSIHEIPDTSFRGYRAFLPAREKVADFEEVLDFITDLKYNTLILEVGGAMEYKKHPKINEKWFEFAKDVHRYSARCDEIQYSYPWSKNSIHVDNADGEILTQDEVRSIVELAKSYNLNVVPEIPSLSHADYLCQAYPEIAERDNDPYPDTYCPSNPKSYEILFDVQDEILEVFKPNMVHIGHDEVYSLCVCDRCKDLDPVQVFVDDIKKIKERFDGMGIKIIMWCDKLFEAFDKRGKGIGGTYHYDETSRGVIIKESLYPCAEYLPKDIILMDWIWGADVRWEYNERRVKKLGYNYVYGNLYFDIKHWAYRTKIGPFGGSVSNWGSYEPDYMQRNLQNASLTKIAYLLWNTSHLEDHEEVLNNKVMQRLFDDAFKGVPEENRLKIVHTSNKEKRYIQFYDGYFIEDDDRLGKYVVEFADGTTGEFFVDYGLNIGNSNVGMWERPHLQTMGKSRSKVVDGKIWYETVFDKGANKKVKSIKFVPNDLNKDVQVEFKII